jgi:hypothetical protein
MKGHARVLITPPNPMAFASCSGEGGFDKEQVLQLWRIFAVYFDLKPCNLAFFAVFSKICIS